MHHSWRVDFGAFPAWIKMCFACFCYCYLQNLTSHINNSLIWLEKQSSGSKTAMDHFTLCSTLFICVCGVLETNCQFVLLSIMQQLIPLWLVLEAKWNKITDHIALIFSILQVDTSFVLFINKVCCIQISVSRSLRFLAQMKISKCFFNIKLYHSRKSAVVLNL